MASENDIAKLSLPFRHSQSCTTSLPPFFVTVYFAVFSLSRINLCCRCFLPSSSFFSRSAIADSFRFSTSLSFLLLSLLTGVRKIVNRSPRSISGAGFSLHRHSLALLLSLLSHYHNAYTASKASSAPASITNFEPLVFRLEYFTCSPPKFFPYFVLFFVIPSPIYSQGGQR